MVDILGFETPCDRSALVKGGDGIRDWLGGCLIRSSYPYLDDSFGVNVRMIQTW